MPNTEITQLPKPTKAALAHSQLLIQHIQQAINKNKGKITFAHFMQLALYAPGLGYYSAGSHKIGEAGDFITAPELTPLFSYCLGKQCAEVLHQITRGSILEFGAGSGRMAADILTYLNSINGLPENYFILEVSADLKQRQQTLLKQQHPQLFDRIIWLDQLPENFSGVILANEIIDAMPVNIFHWQKDQLSECYINDENDQLNWVIDTASESLSTYFETLKSTIDIKQWQTPYRSEINLFIDPWIKSISESLNQGVVFIIDYGFPQKAYYHPQRDQGTLMCHYRHHAHADPLTLIGLQDITAHVDFTAVAKSAIENHLSLEGFVSQANFLVNCGIIDFLGAIDDPNTKHNAKQAIKKLSLPTEMGELFKVIGFSKNYDAETLGFSNFDISHKL